MGKFVTGHKHSPETIKKISDAAKKRKRNPHSEETKRKIGLAHKGKIAPERFGDKAPNWQGGKTNKNMLIRRQNSYKEWIKAVFEKDNYTCVLCEATNTHLHADHIESFAENPEKRLDLENGRTLCRACHYQITFNAIMPVDSKWGANCYNGSRI